MEKKITTFINELEYSQLQQLAEVEHRSLARQVQCLLSFALRNTPKASDAQTQISKTEQKSHTAGGCNE